MPRTTWTPKFHGGPFNATKVKLSYLTSRRFELRLTTDEGTTAVYIRTREATTIGNTFRDLFTGRFAWSDEYTFVGWAHQLPDRPRKPSLSPHLQKITQTDDFWRL